MESAIVNLKAEILKKRGEAAVHSQERKNVHIQKKLVNKNARKLKKEQAEPVDENETNDLQKSRYALEKKAALYDKIKGGIDVLEDDELNEKFLVNFQKKIVNEVTGEQRKSKQEAEKASIDKDTEDRDSNWVDYVDVFGRTRTCHVKDLDYFKDLDRKIAGPAPQPPPEPVDPHAQKLRDKWNKVEDEAVNKRDIHYQDVNFDEVRDHGVGFVKFSRNDAEREVQRQVLKDLRDESKKASISIKSAKKTKQHQLNERLEKVRQKKRLKLGLPVKDLSEQRLRTPPTSDDEDGGQDEPVVEIPLPLNPPKVSTFREWDIGKTTDAGTVLTQTQWVESRRKVRENDFAPPTQYNASKRHKRDRQSAAPESAPSTSTSEESTSRNFDFAPPPTFDYYAPTKKTYQSKPKMNIEDAIDKGLAALRNLCDKK